MVSCLRALLVLLAAELIMVLETVAPVAVLVSFLLVPDWDIVEVGYQSLKSRIDGDNFLELEGEA